MTTPLDRGDQERLIRDFLAIGPTRLSERVYSAVRAQYTTARVDGRVQARASWLGRWPRRQSVYVMLVVGATLALALGAASFGGRPNTALLTATPSPATSEAQAIAYTDADVRSGDVLTVVGRWIYLANPDGGAARRLVEIPAGSPAIELAPVQALGSDSSVHIGPALRWSPDGTRIAFRLYGEPPFGDSPGIYVVNRDGSGLRQVAETAVANPSNDWHYNSTISTFAWSPDSTRIAFISPDYVAAEATGTGAFANGALYVVDVASGTVAKLSGEDDYTDGASGSLSWSPDGTRIAFGRTVDVDRAAERKSMLVVINADGSDERQIVVPTNIPTHLGRVSWSPDGSTIAFVQEVFDSGEDMWTVELVNPDGTDQRTLGGAGMAGCCLHGAFGGLLTWSRDGTRIVNDAGNGFARIMSLTGNGYSGSLVGQSPDWSPDGARIVISDGGQFAGDGRQFVYQPPTLWVLSSYGTGSDGIPIGEGDFPAWSPR